MLRASLPGLLVGAAAMAATTSTPVTFSKDVLPVLHNGKASALTDYE